MYSIAYEFPGQKTGAILVILSIKYASRQTIAGAA